MELNEKKLFKIKILILILYFSFCFVGLPLIFIFPPRKFLFTEGSEDEEDKKYLFKNFVSEIYNNINMKLIDEIILTKKNEECPNDYEVLKIEHQYYGNFTHFFGNSTFCIKRKDDEDMNFTKILEDNRLSCESGKKSCGIVNKISGALLCINENEKCPLNYIEFGTKKKSDSYSSEISDSEGGYFIPKYEPNKEKFLIIDIDLIYKVNLCLEKYHKLETPDCEFYDNDICYIEYKINTERIYYLTINNQDIQLNPINLAHYNLKNDNLLGHDYCVGAQKNKSFNLFSKGFVNFEREDLKNFLEEFKDEKEHNPLSEILDLYKSDKNFEILFYFFSCVLFIWSFLQLALIILVFFVENMDILDLVNKIYLWNGLALFIFKLICFSILLVSYYSFYLKFKPVYLSIENDPRDEILKSYKQLRIIFITKIFVIWLVGFITICMELIILCFVRTFIQFKKETINPQINDEPEPEIFASSKPQRNIQSEKKNLNKEKEKNEEKNHIKEKEQNEEKEKIGEDINNKDLESNLTTKTNLPGSSPPPNVQESLKMNNPYAKIELIFQLIGSNSRYKQKYKIKVEQSNTFEEIETLLKSKYTDLKNKIFDVIMVGTQAIKKEYSVDKYDINELKKDDGIIVHVKEKNENIS